MNLLSLGNENNNMPTVREQDRATHSRDIILLQSNMLLRLEEVESK